MFMSFIVNLANKMLSEGLYPDDIDLTEGKYHRFKSRGECKKKCCGYRIFEQQKGAHLICYRRNIDIIWFDGKSENFSKEDKIFVELEKNRIQEQRRIDQQLKAYKSELFFK